MAIMLMFENLILALCAIVLFVSLPAFILTLRRERKKPVNERKLSKVLIFGILSLLAILIPLVAIVAAAIWFVYVIVTGPL